VASERKFGYPNTSIFKSEIVIGNLFVYEGWNFNSGNYLFTTDTK